jgi:hypothetical protein
VLLRGKAQRRAPAGESESVQGLRDSSSLAHSLLAQQALRMAVPPQLKEPELSARLPLAPPAQLALPPMQQESRALPA